MVSVMAAATIVKGGGLLFLSSRTCSSCPGHPLSTYCSSLYCSARSGKVKGKWNRDGLLRIRPTSFSLLITPSNSKWTAAPLVARRIFCTALNAADSAAVSAPPSSSEVDNEDDKDKVIDGDLKIVKDAANTLDIRVGRIIRAWRHEDADSLYVEEVDVGEPQSRIICSGLVNYIPLDHLQDRKVIVLANLKPRNMRGVKSQGMLMAASDASHENVELLLPPEGSVPGERVWFGSADEKENLPDTAAPNQMQKKKIWELVQPHLKTDTSCTATLGMHFMRTSAGIVGCKSLKNANIS